MIGQTSPMNQILFLPLLSWPTLYGYGTFASPYLWGQYNPSNFEPLAKARQQHAKYLWRTSPVGTLTSQIARHQIDINMSPPPTPAEIGQFSLAYADSIHKGVLDPAGNRLPPPFPHHVDDNLYADTARYLAHTIAASVLALYAIFGDPHPDRIDLLSREKFTAFHNH